MATTGISLVREQTERMRLPRFLWVPFELGRPFGAPNEPDFQRRVLRAALELLDRTDGPVVLADFPEDAPVSDDEAVWACPISFAPKPTEEPELIQETRAEIRRLAPWAQLGRRPLPSNSGMDRDAIVGYLGRVAAGLDVSAELGDRSLIEATRLAADDLRTWYLQAASRQPGRSSTEQLTGWFWRQTAFAHLLGEVTARLLQHPDPNVRSFAARALVPRDHVASLVPDTPSITGVDDASDHP